MHDGSVAKPGLHLVLTRDKRRFESDPAHDRVTGRSASTRQGDSQHRCWHCGTTKPAVHGDRSVRHTDPDGLDTRSRLRSRPRRTTVVQRSRTPPRGSSTLLGGSTDVSTDRCCIQSGTSRPRTIRHFHDRERQRHGSLRFGHPTSHAIKASHRQGVASSFLAAPCAQKPRVAADTCVIRSRHRDIAGPCSQRRLCGLATTHVIPVERPATWMFIADFARTQCTACST